MGGKALESLHFTKSKKTLGYDKLSPIAIIPVDAKFFEGIITTI